MVRRLVEQQSAERKGQVRQIVMEGQENVLSLDVAFEFLGSLIDGLPQITAGALSAAMNLERMETGERTKGRKMMNSQEGRRDERKRKQVVHFESTTNS